ncbi:MAG: hypothetical protein SFY80_13490 [Verrucomicrobiota bacterium]|nr:hypothetical protein [Verrucomicrobiota bacterium]
MKPFTTLTAFIAYSLLSLHCQAQTLWQLHTDDGASKPLPSDTVIECIDGKSTHLILKQVTNNQTNPSVTFWLWVNTGGDQAVFPAIEFCGNSLGIEHHAGVTHLQVFDKEWKSIATLESTDKEASQWISVSLSVEPSKKQWSVSIDGQQRYSGTSREPFVPSPANLIISSTANTSLALQFDAPDYQTIAVKTSAEWVDEVASILEAVSLKNQPNEIDPSKMATLFKAPQYTPAKPAFIITTSERRTDPATTIESSVCRADYGKK